MEMYGICEEAVEPAFAIPILAAEERPKAWPSAMLAPRNDNFTGHCIASWSPSNPRMLGKQLADEQVREAVKKQPSDREKEAAALGLRSTVGWE